MAKSPGERFASFAHVLEHLQPAPRAASPWQDEQDPEFTNFWERYQQRRSHYLSNASDLRTPDVYHFPDGRTLKILRGNIVDQHVNAIVSSDDEYLSQGGGASLAIQRAADSDSMQRELQNYVPVRPGRVVVTSAGNLKVRFVFHAVTFALRDYGFFGQAETLSLRFSIAACIDADTLNVQSLALPLLGTGAGQFSRDVCLDTMCFVSGQNLDARPHLLT